MVLLSHEMLAMINTVRVFSSDIQMKSRFNKCFLLIIKRSNVGK